MTNKEFPDTSMDDSELGPVGLLLKDPARWTKRANARDESGWIVSILDPNAACFCLSGAFQKIYGTNIWDHPAGRRLEDEVGEPYSYDPIGFNDHLATTHQDIMSILRKTKV